MRQWLSFQEHSRRGNASSHPDRRATLRSPYTRVAVGPYRGRTPKSEQAIRRAPAGLGEKGARTALPITLLAKKRSNQQDDRTIHQEVAQTGGLSCSA
jgi:hypothetical protein